MTAPPAGGGEGGVIAMDRSGAAAISMNVTGMGRGYMGADGTASIQLVAGSRQAKSEK